jgi:Cytochrome c oxidase subunit IV
VRTASRVAFGVGAFVLVAGLVYWFTAHERTGATLLVILSIGFFYIALVVRGAARGADEASSSTGEQAGEEHAVAPTIWPFGFSLAALGLILGVVVQRWLLIVGGALFLAAAGGWFNDIRRQHADGQAPGEHGQAPGEGTETP